MDELVDEVAVGAVKLDTIESRIERTLSRDAEFLDDAGDFLDVECTVGRSGHKAVLRQRHAFKRHDRRCNGIDATRHFYVALTPAVNELHEHVATLCVNGIHNRLPAFHLAVVIETGRAEIGACRYRDADALDDFEAAFRSALAVEVSHHRARNVAGLNGAQACHRCEHDAMRDGVRANFC